MATSTISYLWRDKEAPKGFRTGVSLHSHTNQSRETLDFLANFGNQYPVMRPLLSRLERRAERDPRRARELRGQLLDAAHDPQAGLRPGKRGRSKSWTWRRWFPSPTTTTSRRPCCCAPCPARGRFRFPSSGARPTAAQSFHLGVHNLPSARATEWMATLAEYTAHPSDARLTEILAALNDEPNVLVVFNHPMWDLYLIGKEKHAFLVNEFLAEKRRIPARAGAERPAQLGREPRACAAWPRSGTCCSSPAATATASSPTPTST